jgi:hypothetical protein
VNAAEAAELKAVLSLIHPDAVVEVTPETDGVNVWLAGDGVNHRWKIDGLSSPLVRALGLGVPL